MDDSCVLPGRADPEAQDSQRPDFPESASRAYLEERLLSTCIIDAPPGNERNPMSAIIARAPMVRLLGQKNPWALAPHVPVVWTYYFRGGLEVSYRSRRRKVIVTPPLEPECLSTPHAIVHILKRDGSSRKSPRPLFELLCDLITNFPRVTIVGGSDACYLVP